MNENAFILERKCFFISFYQFGGRLEATFAFEIRTYRQTIVNDNNFSHSELKRLKRNVNVFPGRFQ